jgi:hypothetical protein
MFLANEATTTTPVVGRFIGNVIVDIVVFGTIVLLIYFLVISVSESKLVKKARMLNSELAIESSIKQDEQSGFLRLLAIIVSIGGIFGLFLPQLDFTGLLPKSFGFPQSLSLMNSIWQCIFHAPSWFFTRNSIRSEFLALSALIISLISSIYLAVLKTPSRLLFKVRQFSSYAALLGMIWSIWLLKSLIDSLDSFLQLVGNEHQLSLFDILGAGVWVSVGCLVALCVLTTIDALKSS